MRGQRSFEIGTAIHATAQLAVRQLGTMNARVHPSIPRQATDFPRIYVQYELYMEATRKLSSGEFRYERDLRTAYDEGSTQGIFDN